MSIRSPRGALSGCPETLKRSAAILLFTCLRAVWDCRRGEGTERPLYNEDVKLAGALIMREAAGDNSYIGSHVTPGGTARSLHQVR
jgi:hypothetical protein